MATSGTLLAPIFRTRLAAATWRNSSFTFSRSASSIERENNNNTHPNLNKQQQQQKLPCRATQCDNLRFDCSLWGINCCNVWPFQSSHICFLLLLLFQFFLFFFLPSFLETKSKRTPSTTHSFLSIQVTRRVFQLLNVATISGSPKPCLKLQPYSFALLLPIFP